MNERGAPLTIEPPLIPQRLRQLMAEIGPKWGTNIQQHIQLMLDEFSMVLKDAPKSGVVARDIPYDSHPRQVLDVYKPVDGDRLPVVMFVHGGAFVDGDKDRTTEIHSNILWYFARNGVLGINVEFRLAPEFKFPAGTEDIALAVAWARANVARFGGDPERIFLMGHSAGACHSAHYAYDQRFHPLGGPGLAGLIVASGRVRSENSAENPNAKRVEAYYGADPAKMEEGSAVNYATSTSIPTMIAVAQYENPLLDVHCVELFHRLTQAKRHAPRFVWLARHNHTSAVAHFNTSDDALGREILDFMRETLNREHGA